MESAQAWPRRWCSGSSPRRWRKPPARTWLPAMKPNQAELRQSDLPALRMFRQFALAKICIAYLLLGSDRNGLDHVAGRKGFRSCQWPNLPIGQNGWTGPPAGKAPAVVRAA